MILIFEDPKFTECCSAPVDGMYSTLDAGTEDEIGVCSECGEWSKLIRGVE